VLVPERDHEKLAAALLDAVKDPGSLSRTALNGAGCVRKNFDLRAQARRLEEIYLRMIPG
jgi:glycosyltransferase involved in cell wall biosynthesis